jgi:hypothetical protein
MDKNMNRGAIPIHRLSFGWHSAVYWSPVSGRAKELKAAIFVDRADLCAFELVSQLTRTGERPLDKTLDQAPFVVTQSAIAPITQIRALLEVPE